MQSVGLCLIVPNVHLQIAEEVPNRHPNLTLEDPEIPAIWNARGRSELITYGSKSDGNAIRRILRTDHRTYKIEVSSGNNGTGTYQLKVRVNNICRINDDGDAQYQ